MHSTAIAERVSAEPDRDHLPDTDTTEPGDDTAEQGTPEPGGDTDDTH